MALHGMNKIRDRGLGILIYGDTFHCLVQEKLRDLCFQLR